MPQLGAFKVIVRLGGRGVNRTSAEAALQGGATVSGADALPIEIDSDAIATKGQTMEVRLSFAM